MANEAIGILFEVLGRGSINGDVNKVSGALINKQLGELVEKINNSDTVKIKFQVDTQHLSKQLKDQLQDVVKQATGSNGGGSSTKSSKNTSETKQQSAAFKEAKKAITEYFTAKTKYERKASRSDDPSKEYKDLVKIVREAKKQGQDYFTVVRGGNIKLKEDIEGVTEAQREALAEFVKSKNIQFNADKNDISKSAQTAWDHASAKARDYIRNVEYAASRDEGARERLSNLNEVLATKDARNLNKLNEVLYETKEYIDENSLATETWGQKMLKTFGSRVRSALAGIITAKLGQWLNDIYKNVVNLDKAMTNLQIASGKTREEVKELVTVYSELGKQLGATTAQVAESADTWLRQGYSTADTNTLIANSMMLSKLGQIESAEAATYLTSAMKGYNVTVQDSIKIVDKWTAVDMIAAANAGDLATAMAETSTSARIAGVSMDTLIGYIATVKEVTQDSAESVGTFMKTLFARMNNVAAGNFVDEETGESLNDVETVLNRLGIALRDSNGQFRNSGEVLDEVASKWQTFDSVAQHAIATAFAGTRQQEKFTTLMEHYGSAMKYAKASTEAAGTAQEKYGAYTESIEGKLAALTATFEQLSMTVLNAEWLATGIEALTGIVSALNGIASIGDGAVVAITAIAAASLLLVTGFDFAKNKITELIIKHAELAGVQTTGAITTEVFNAALNHMGTTGLLGAITLIPRMIWQMGRFVISVISGTSATVAFKAALDALNINPVMLAITAAIGVFVGAVAAINEYQKSLENLSKQTQATINATTELNRKLQEEESTLNDLIKSYYELAKANKGVYDSDAHEEILRIQNQINETIQDQSKHIDLLNAKYEDLGKTMRSLALIQSQQAAFSVDETKKSIQIVQEAAEEYLYDYVLANQTIGFNVVARWQGSLDKTISHLEDQQSKIQLYKNDIEPLLTELKSYQNIIDGLSYSLTGFVLSYEDSVMRSGDILGYDGVITDIDEYAAYKQELIEAAKANEDLHDANGNLIEDHEQMLEQVEHFMQLNYGDIFAKLTLSAYGANYQLKGFINIAEEVSDEWDAMTSAISDMEKQGALSIDTYQKLLEVFPDIEEMKFVSDDGTSTSFIEETASGYYKLNGTIEDYIKLKQEELVAVLASNREESDAYQNAYADLQSLMSVYNTMMLEQEIEAATKRLEQQLDTFEEIVDLRKELLDTYKDEIDYQRELQKKQRAVTDAQTKLSISRLDTSAAGQARTRELEQELQDAQDELDDFTLEHAIDVLTVHLEAEKQEYTSLINEEIAHLRTASKNTTMIKDAINDLLELRKLDANKTANDEKNLARNDLQSYIDENKITAGADKSSDIQYQNLLQAAIDKGVASTSGGVEAMMKWHDSVAEIGQSITPNGYKYVDIAKKHGNDRVKSRSGDNFKIDVNGVVYRVQSNGQTLSSEESVNAETAVRNAGGVVQEGAVIKKDGVLYVYTFDGKWVAMEDRPGIGNGDYSRMEKALRQYHTGGFVGDIITLSSNEEFAKLLEGEFVSTPAQMRRFMEKTLPQIASYSTTNGKNEFNAPLVEITCESVTTESFPKLERVVHEAVREIQKQLDSGMSRTGFKRQTVKRLV